MQRSRTPREGDAQKARPRPTSPRSRLRRSAKLVAGDLGDTTSRKTWKIAPTSPKTAYTGYFAPGKEGRVIARYSLGGNHPEGGHNRSLGLAGKVFPSADAREGDTPRAHFITQEDLGGAFTDSVTEAVLTNSPPVTLLNRGSGLFAFIPVIVALLRADAQPADGSSTRSPRSRRRRANRRAARASCGS